MSMCVVTAIAATLAFGAQPRKASDPLVRYVHSLGPAGVAAPSYVPPTQEPKPPFVTFPAPPK